MNQNLFEMCFELEDIIDIEESGYKNVYDISVSGNHSFLLSNGIVSHNSAAGGLIPVFGRSECGYYALRGKPLNAYSAQHSKFIGNKELKELFEIIQSETTFTPKPDGKWYTLEVDGKEYIVNENDTIKINDLDIDVSSLI